MSDQSDDDDVIFLEQFTKVVTEGSPSMPQALATGEAAELSAANLGRGLGTPTHRLPAHEDIFAEGLVKELLGDNIVRTSVSARFENRNGHAEHCNEDVDVKQNTQGDRERISLENLKSIASSSSEVFQQSDLFRVDQRIVDISHAELRSLLRKALAIYPCIKVTCRMERMKLKQENREKEKQLKAMAIALCKIRHLSCQVFSSVYERCPLPKLAECMKEIASAVENENAIQAYLTEEEKKEFCYPTLTNIQKVLLGAEAGVPPLRSKELGPSSTSSFSAATAEVGLVVHKTVPKSAPLIGHYGKRLQPTQSDRSAGICDIPENSRLREPPTLAYSSQVIPTKPKLRDHEYEARIQEIPCRNVVAENGQENHLAFRSHKKDITNHQRKSVFQDDRTDSGSASSRVRTSEPLFGSNGRPIFRFASHPIPNGNSHSVSTLNTPTLSSSKSLTKRSSQDDIRSVYPPKKPFHNSESGGNTGVVEDVIEISSDEETDIKARAVPTALNITLPFFKVFKGFVVPNPSDNWHKGMEMVRIANYGARFDEDFKWTATVGVRHITSKRNIEVVIVYRFAVQDTELGFDPHFGKWAHLTSYKLSGGLETIIKIQFHPRQKIKANGLVIAAYAITGQPAKGEPSCSRSDVCPLSSGVTFTFPDFNC